MQTKVKGFIIAIIALLLSVWLGSLLYRQLSDVPLIFHRQSESKADRLHRKFVKGKEEVVTFFARESADSDKMIARKAILIRRPNAVATVFIFHGFMCDKQDIRFLTNALFGDMFAGMPVNTMTIDFRAHGEMTEGQCCSFGYNEMWDVIGAVDFVKADPELSQTKRIAYGFSMGAVSSILAEAEEPGLFDLAIWDCPFESTTNVIARAVEQLRLNVLGYDFNVPGKGLLQSYAYNTYVQSFLKFMLKTVAKMDASQVHTCIMPVDTLAAIKDISIPVLLIGCRNDEKAPIAGLRDLYNALGGYKRLWITNGRNHFDSYFYNPEKYIYKVRRFIQKVLDGTYRERYPAYVSEDTPEDDSKRVLDSLYSW